MMVLVLLQQEEVAAINLSKYRKVTAELEDAQERADTSEQTLSRLRAKNRSSVSSTRSFGAPGVGLTSRAPLYHNIPNQQDSDTQADRSVSPFQCRTIRD